MYDIKRNAAILPQVILMSFKEKKIRQTFKLLLMKKKSETRENFKSFDRKATEISY